MFLKKYRNRGFTALEINRQGDRTSLIGITIVEMMVVLTIVAVLIAIAVPTYARLRRDAKAKVCKANLKQIESAIDQWSFEYDVEEGTALTAYKNEIYTYLVSGEPSCPSGGKYVLTYLGSSPQVLCSSSLEGHEYP